MSKSGWSWHKLSNLITLTLIITSRINLSIILWTGLGFIFKCICLHVCKNVFAYKFFFIFTVFRLLKSAFVKIPCPLHDLIINPPCRTATTYKFTHRNLFTHLSWEVFFQKKVPLYFRGDTMTLLHLNVMLGYMFLQYLQVSGLKVINILDFTKMRTLW